MFLATWLNEWVFGDSLRLFDGSFLIDVEMARGKKYSLVVLHLAWAYNYLGEFKEVNGQVTRTYGSWALILG